MEIYDIIRHLKRQLTPMEEFEEMIQELVGKGRTEQEARNYLQPLFNEYLRNKTKHDMSILEKK